MSLLPLAALRWPATPAQQAERVAWSGAAVAWLGLAVLAVPVAAGHAHGADAPAGLGLWVAYPAMVVAMMWPLTGQVLSLVVRSSFPSRRGVHAGIILGVSTALWVAFGAALHGMTQLLGWASGPWWSLGWLAVGIAVSWLPGRARILRTCLRLPPIHPGGRRGVTTAAQAAVVFWRRCAILCGPVMAAMVTSHSLPVMVLASASVWWEQWHPRASTDPVPPLLLGAAAVVVCLEWVLA